MSIQHKRIDIGTPAPNTDLLHLLVIDLMQQI